MTDRPPSAGAGVRRNLFALIQDALRLGDLQLQLLQVDVRDFWQRARLAIVICVIAGIAMLAALPILLLGLTYVLQAATGWSLATSSLVIGGSVIALGGGGAWLSIRNVTRAGSLLARSREEFQQNLAWLRSAVHGAREE